MEEGVEARPAGMPDQAVESRRFSRYAFGLVDQVLSSATNVGLFVAVGRLLGASGLGAVSLGFAAYLVALIVHRAAVTQPVVVVTATAGPEERQSAIDRATTVTGIWALAVAGLLALVGVALRASVGRGLLLVAPWLPSLLIQDQCRFLLFRDRRERAAVANDLTWVLVMGASLAVALSSRSDWLVVGAWGMGATAGAVLGLRQLRVTLVVADAVDWWRRVIWPLGRWWALSRLVYSAGGQAAVLFIAPLVTAGAIGGLRAVQSVFAPLTVLIPAASMPGLPAITRALHRSVPAARRLAARLSIALLLTASAYMAVVFLMRRFILTEVFGSSFAAFASLAAPVAVNQVATAAGTGALLFLMSAARKGSILLSHGANSAVSIGLAIALAAASGVEGAAWGALPSE